jgi:hypothetical protein
VKLVFSIFGFTGNLQEIIIFFAKKHRKFRVKNCSAMPQILKNYNMGQNSERSYVSVPNYLTEVSKKPGLQVIYSQKTKLPNFFIFQRISGNTGNFLAISMSFCAKTLCRKVSVT